MLDPGLGRVQQALLPASLAGPGAGRGASRRWSASTPGRALRVASLIGYLFVAPVLFLLLRRRFPPGLSAGLAVACTLAPPVYKWSLGMRVDSWGLMLEALGLLAAVLVKDLGRRWLAALGRGDRGAVDHARRRGDPAPGGGVAAVRRARATARPRRTNLALLGTGIAAAVPAFLIGGTAVRDNLAYVIAGYTIPVDSSWSYVASGYLDQLWRTISTDPPTRWNSRPRSPRCSTPGSRSLRRRSWRSWCARRAAIPTSR